MNPSTSSPTGLKPAVPLLELLLRIREDMEARLVGPYRYIGMPDVDWVNCFRGGYGACLHSMDVDEGPDLLFGTWFRDIKRAWPAEGWESVYLSECGGDQTRALRKFLDYVAEFRALSPEALAALPWNDPECDQLATSTPRLTPARMPATTLDFLMEIRQRIGDSVGRLFMFIGPITVRRMEGLIAGYRLCLGLVGARDEEYVRFERWLQDEKGVPVGQEWAQPFLAACQGDHEQAIRRLLGYAAEFRSA
ncbi:hypothetical protein D187_005217 [Cystobacter fuscus DSM 2262]|uniref:Uncharacterized protein n=1 Tax=Cystobacter fuscus (strain ATCC 25194 / DSM 2262 / NBRC 100088 / M29) TaxID=1242864 RepID=S9QS49_CYSF2|nr:hypothetical protein [Cystobacter fuscus]EPX64084.1 hypothetical protein D187_005217 [Cystobacter fuscus DSM 2262]